MFSFLGQGGERGKEMKIDHIWIMTQKGEERETSSLSLVPKIEESTRVFEGKKKNMGDYLVRQSEISNFIKSQKEKVNPPSIDFRTRNKEGRWKRGRSRSIIFVSIEERKERRGGRERSLGI